MEFSLSCERHMKHLAGIGGWIFSWDMGPVRRWRVSSGTTGVTSNCWPERCVVTVPCSRSTKGSLRGILYPPPYLTCWLTLWFVTGSRWWQVKKRYHMALVGWSSGWRRSFTSTADFLPRPGRPGPKWR